MHRVLYLCKAQITRRGRGVVSIRVSIIPWLESRQRRRVFRLQISSFSLLSSGKLYYIIRQYRPVFLSL